MDPMGTCIFVYPEVNTKIRGRTKTYPTPIRWMLFIEHYQGDTGYIWVPPVRAFRHSTFRLVASAPFYIISWSPLSHESEVPAYIKKRQVPFFGAGKDQGNVRGSRVDVLFVVCQSTV